MYEITYLIKRSLWAAISQAESTMQGTNWRLIDYVAQDYLSYYVFELGLNVSRSEQICTSASLPISDCIRMISALLRVLGYILSLRHESLTLSLSLQGLVHTLAISICTYFQVIFKFLSCTLCLFLRLDWHIFIATGIVTMTVEPIKEIFME